MQSSSCDAPRGPFLWHIHIHSPGTQSSPSHPSQHISSTSGIRSGCPCVVCTPQIIWSAFSQHLGGGSPENDSWQVNKTENPSKDAQNKTEIVAKCKLCKLWLHKPEWTSLLDWTGDETQLGDQTLQADQTYQSDQDWPDLPDKDSHRIEYERGGARTIKHAKLPISSFDQSVSYIRSSVQEMLAHLKTVLKSLSKWEQFGSMQNLKFQTLPNKNPPNVIVVRAGRTSKLLESIRLQNSARKMPYL